MVAPAWPCRGCLGPLGAGAEAGLCARCWSGLVPLAEERCPRCALAHGGGAACPEPVLWRLGDALWDYHGGLGALLVPAIKAGETGWLSALLERVSRNRWPEFARTADLVCAVPTSWPRRWRRGFDLAEAAGALVAGRLGKPFRGLLRKAWFAPAQAGRSESLRRRLPVNAIRPCRDRRLHGETVLLVDDVWTTGTTLARAARALGGIGAGAVLVLALFRACPATAKVL